MKKIKLSLATAILLFFAIPMLPGKSTAQVSVSFQVFYDDLAPYGNWITYPGYGYVWVPGAGSDFRPYVTGGHWAYSDAGWVWVSNYDWGWAPFHYGSWIDDPSYGWVWVPGYDWAPAWVTWGSYGGYYGWAPVGPGYAIGNAYYPPVNNWCFIEPRYMTAGDWGHHYYVGHNNRIEINNTVIINNEKRISMVSNTANYGGRGYNAGPRRQEFEKTAHTTVTPVSLRESGRPGKAQISNNSVSIYRPKINAGTKIASRPAKVAAPEQVKASSRSSAGQNNGAMQRNASNKPAPGNRQLQPAYQSPKGAASPAKSAIQNTGRQMNSSHSAIQQSPAAVQHQQRNQAPAQRQQQRAPSVQRNVPQQQHTNVPQQQHNVPQQQHIQMRQPAPQQHVTAPQQRQAAPAMRQQAAPRPQAAPEPKQEPVREAAPPQGGEQHGEGRGPRNFR